MEDSATKSANDSVLVVAGFDPSGYAGLLADMRAIEAVGAAGVGIPTAITFQSAFEFSGYETVPVAWLDTQLQVLLSRTRPAAVKIGMLGTAGTVSWICQRLRSEWGPVVLDPVLEATRAGSLVDGKGWKSLKQDLLARVFIVTPNIREAEALSGLEEIRSLQAMKTAARRIIALGVRHVIITGGHLEEDCPDLWFDGENFLLLRSARIRTDSVRGLGTMFSGALAAFLSQGMDVEPAVIAAKTLVAGSLARRIPGSTGPLMPSWKQAGESSEVEVEHLA